MHKSVRESVDTQGGVAALFAGTAGIEGESVMKTIQYMCPHCGWCYDADKSDDGLVPTHDFPKPCRSVCPGSKQTPRNPHSDKRPLWKDGGVQ